MMNEEREVLQAENADLRRLLDETMAKLSKEELNNGDLRDRLIALQREADIACAKLEVVELIFGGRR